MAPRDVQEQRLSRRRRSREAAQSLTVAIIVLFLLLFLGGLFIALVVNNLRNVKTSANRSAADKFSEAGLKYLDDQLTNSPEGADWRPVPFVVDPGDFTVGADGRRNYISADSNGNGVRNPEPLPTLDPDYEWLRPCSDPDVTGADQPCGYTRVQFGGPTPSQGNLGGRALVRVTYSPSLTDTGSPTDAASKYLKLEAVGRAGYVDASDPTTYASSEGKGLRRELLAYKQIGLVEYLRHITNKNDRPTVAALGSPNKVLDAPYVAGDRVGNAPVQRDIESFYYGSIHSNAPLTFNGLNHIFLNPNLGEALTVSSQIRVAGTTDITSTAGGVTAQPVASSIAASFNTYGGLVRDNYPQGQGQGNNLRNVTKTSAPLIDASTGTGDLTRYRMLTRNSEVMDSRYTGPTNATSLNTLIGTAGVGPDYPGRIGWGAGLYINNPEDVQRPSELLVGGYSPRADWLGATRSQWWRDDSRYVPPATILELTPRFFKVSRSTTSTNRGLLRGPDGRRVNQATIVRWSGLGNGIADTAPSVGLSADMRAFEGYPALPIGNNTYEGDYVIYAEGNIRIRGTVGGKDPETGRYYIRHLTVVSNGTVYIDGSVLKDNLVTGDPQFNAVHGKSSIALLAKDYVVVNTTQFNAPGDNMSEPETSGSDTTAVFLNSASPSFPFRLTQAPAQTFGVNGLPGPTTPPAYTPELYLRHAAKGTDGATAVRTQVNNGYYDFGAFAWPNSNPLGTTLALSPLSDVGTYYDNVFALAPAQLYPANASLYTFPASYGIDNLLAMLYDPSAGVPNQTDYRLSRLGIAPNDIRIEALIYAQEGSFFVIPGPWFNPDPNDTYERYVLPDPTVPASTARLARSGENQGTFRINPRFPFYGEPQDIRITILGAITENLPAEVGDQSAWLEKWGWVPHYRGSTGLPSAPGFSPQGNTELTVHGPQGILPGPKLLAAGAGGGSGIVYIYDTTLVRPYDSASRPLRTDIYQRTLPSAPRLPVAPGLIYAGEATN